MRGTNSFKPSLTLNFISEQSCVRKEQKARIQTALLSFIDFKTARQK